MSEVRPSGAGVKPKGSLDLKQRIKRHYDNVTDKYISAWGQHIHHGYFNDQHEDKSQVQVNLINALLEISSLGRNSKVLDIGCGVGGTSRFLAKELSCAVTGITISSRQVDLAQSLTAAEIKSLPSPKSTQTPGAGDFMHYPNAGSARFLELDAANMSSRFDKETFDCVWICEALYHIPDKERVFADAFSLLAPGGSKLIIADWFKAPDLDSQKEAQYISPIEAGMLTQPLHTMDEYVAMAEKAGFSVRQAPKDITQKVSPTWEKIAENPFTTFGIWLLAVWIGRDGIGYVKGMKAMKRGYASGAFKYAIMCFEKR